MPDQRPESPAAQKSRKTVTGVPHELAERAIATPLEPARFTEIMEEYQADRERDSEELCVRRLAHALERAEFARDGYARMWRWPWWRRLRGR